MKRVLWILLSAQLGCAAASEVEPSVEAGSSSQALGVGDRGAKVRAVYDYLAKYGYFPNGELADSYPGFKPLVAQAPRDFSVFDDRLADAVRIFQARMGLEPTGTVDEATQATMEPRFCSWPDGYTHAGLGADSDAHEHGDGDKFRIGSTANINLTTWSLENLPAGQTDATISGLIQEQLNKWSAVHKNSFTRVAAGQGQAKIKFVAIDGPVMDTNGDNRCDTGCIGGQASVGGPTLQIDSGERWEYTGIPTTTVPYNQRKTDFRSVVLHEFGHILGLDHSSLTGDTVMYPAVVLGSTKRLLTGDERVAIRSRFASWINVATPAPVVDVTGSPLAIITNEPAGLGGFKIYRNNGTSWVNLPGAATRISADVRFRLWVVNSVGGIYYRPSADTDWVPLQGCATDIAVSWNNISSSIAYAVGCDGFLYQSNFDAGAPDATLFANKDAGWTRINTPGAAPFVSVGAGTMATTHAVTAVDANGDSWGFQTTFLFQKLALTNNIQMGDAGGSWDGFTTWATGKNGVGVFALNFQPLVTGASAVSGWSGYPTMSAKRVGVDYAGKPFIVTSSGGLMTTSK